MRNAKERAAQARVLFTAIKVLLATCICLSTVWTVAPTTNALEGNRLCDGQTKPCRIGDIGPGGGVVFYDAGAPQPWGQYLEAAPAGWGEGEALYVPNSPQILRVKATQNGIFVRWSPVNEATGYRVATVPQSVGCQTNRTRCVISNVRPKVDYSVVVYALSEVGASVGSEAAVRTPAKPKSPKRPTSPVRPSPSPTKKPKPTFRALLFGPAERQMFSAVSVPVEPVAQWCIHGTPGALNFLPTDTSIGAGERNTKIITDACGEGTAAGVASSYEGGNQNDWYLPSRDELAELYRWHQYVGGFELHSESAYWSSSQASDFSGSALLIDFKNGVELSNFKERGGGANLRPIRAFGS